MHNFGWISDLKMSMEGFGQDASIYHLAYLQVVPITLRWQNSN